MPTLRVGAFSSAGRFVWLYRSLKYTKLFWSLLCFYLLFVSCAVNQLHWVFRDKMRCGDSCWVKVNTQKFIILTVSCGAFFSDYRGKNTFIKVNNSRKRLLFISSVRREIIYTMSTSENNTVYNSCNNNHSLQATGMLLKCYVKHSVFGFQMLLMCNLPARVVRKKKSRWVAQQFKHIRQLGSNSAHAESNSNIFSSIFFSDSSQMLNEAINQIMFSWKVQNLK